ncbi:hypothetical protein HPB47_016936 [Ixodes persulcatus]|uniref:Uncharacterized protein n=1 Tax=Ixodes persulcatus TaxID=34615 RepID=A0AC60QPR0_IXOPE|nr:hypothetical protein HPB47_016936 [Ixodes persulcatus]
MDFGSSQAADQTPAHGSVALPPPRRHDKPNQTRPTDDPPSLSPAPGVLKLLDLTSIVRTVPSCGSG